METGMFLGPIAVAAAMAAFLGVFAAVREGSEILRRKSVVLAAQGQPLSLPGLVGLRVRSGFAALDPLVRRLLRVRKIDGFARELALLARGRGWEATPESVLSVLVAAVLAVFLLVWLAVRNVIAGVAVAACMVAVTVVLVGSAQDKQREAVREEVPNVLELMSACFGSGFTLLQTFQQISQEIPGYLGKLFGRGAHVLETGGSVNQALDLLRSNAHGAELAFVVVALDVQHQSGGALKQVLATASQSVKGELALRRSLRVQTAQAKLSARIVIVMPFILIAIFCLISPGFLDPFFNSLAGYGLLALALLMQMAGIALVHRALSVDGVS